MRCIRIQRLLVQFEDVVLPAFVSDHLKHCADCRLFLEKNAQVRRLLSLKNHERPAAGVEQRIAADVLRTIRTGAESRPADEAWSPLPWLFPKTFPALRLAVATALVALVAIQILNLPKLRHAAEPSGSGTAMIEPSTPDRPVPSVTPVAAPLLAREAAYPESYAVSNRGNDRLEYGPLRSVPASFDY